ncbi:MAG: hypothetical protein WC488_01790 [Candidatus Micrarchaeia archaeon]
MAGEIDSGEDSKGSGAGAESTGGGFSFGKALGDFAKHGKLSTERDLAVKSLAALALLFALIGIGYLAAWKHQPGFAQAKLPLLALGAIATVVLVASGVQYSAYGKRVTCMTGMMEGMTFGMMAGFVPGALLGASNGMFWGSVTATSAGLAAGVWAGRRCGIMGVMEGMMAGLMAGTMGAMLSVMLLAEPLVPFLAFITAICVAILLGLAHMQVEELGLSGWNAPSLFSLTSINVVFFAVLAWMMVYGPASGPVFAG